MSHTVKEKKRKKKKKEKQKKKKRKKENKEIMNCYGFRLENSLKKSSKFIAICNVFINFLSKTVFNVLDF